MIEADRKALAAFQGNVNHHIFRETGFFFRIPEKLF
jgi:hypothetical protein